MNVDAGQERNAPAGAGQFADAGLLGTLEATGLDGIDAFGFGLIVMDRDGRVLGYNQAESKLSGLPADGVVGRNFFVEIGPCPNNSLAAQRYRDSASQETSLDEQLDYVFTYRMAPTPVRLRLLGRRGSAREYLGVGLAWTAPS